METPAKNEEVSEFAQKQPLIEKSFYKKFFRGLFLFIGLIVIIIGVMVFAVASDFVEKILIAEVPVSADGIYTAISWKDQKVITYSKCLSVGNACEIFSYDIINNSL